MRHSFSLFSSRGLALLALLASLSLSSLAASPSSLKLMPRSAPPFADLIDTALPSIVQLRVTRRAAPAENDPLGELIRRFEQANPDAAPKDQQSAPLSPLDDGKTPAPDQEQSKKSPSKETPKDKEKEKEDPSDGISLALGTGFFIDDSGLMLTNAHVVLDSDSIVARFSDLSERPATLIGLDRRTDVALLRVQAAPGQHFRPLTIGSSVKTRVGSWTLAIGSPFGFEFSASLGILSAKNRSIPSEENNYVAFLQTDAAINPGNSGGPLFDEKGAVIGMNTQIFSRSGGSMGLSFAIPIEHALRIAAQIQRDGRAHHGRIGAMIQDMSLELAAALGVPGRHGAVILDTEPDSPAARAGLLPGDALLAVNGQPARSQAEFIRAIASSDPGSSVSLTVFRQGAMTTIPLVVGEAPVDTAKAKPEPKPRAPKLEGTATEPVALGLRVRALTPEEIKAQKSDLGLLVLAVEGAAADFGVSVGDVLLQVQGRPLRSLDDLQSALASTNAPTLAALLRRGPIRVILPLPRSEP